MVLECFGSIFIFYSEALKLNDEDDDPLNSGEEKVAREWNCLGLKSGVEVEKLIKNFFKHNVLNIFV